MTGPRKGKRSATDQRSGPSSPVSPWQESSAVLKLAPAVEPDPEPPMSMPLSSADDLDEKTAEAIARAMILIRERVRGITTIGVASTIAGMLDWRGEAEVGLRRLADVSGAGRRTVIREVARLEASGVLLVERHSGDRSRYWFAVAPVPHRHPCHTGTGATGAPVPHRPRPVPPGHHVVGGGGSSLEKTTTTDARVLQPHATEALDRLEAYIATSHVGRKIKSGDVAAYRHGVRQRVIRDLLSHQDRLDSVDELVALIDPPAEPSPLEPVKVRCSVCGIDNRWVIGANGICRSCEEPNP